MSATPREASAAARVERRASVGDEAEMATPLVAIRNLSKYYVRGDQVIPVLVDIDLDVNAGASCCR